MRILLHFNTYGYKSYHAFAKKLKELVPNTEFGIAGGAPIALEYLRNQNDIDYWKLNKKDSEIYNNRINFDELREFEERLPHKSLWRVIATDRVLGRAFLHGIVGYEQEKQCDRSYILSAFNNKLRYYKILFESFKPDIFIPAMAMGDIGVTLIRQLCDKYGVLYAIPDSVRVQNYCCFTDSEQILFPNIDETYKKVINNEVTLDLTAANRLYDELTDELYAASYFDANNERMNRFKHESLLQKLKTLFIKIPVASMKMMINGLICRKKIKSIMYSIRNYILLQLQKNRLTAKNYGTFLDPDQKYIYYPLHINPEYSTLIQGTMFGNQLSLIEALAKSIPVDWVVYVKEHPAMVKGIVRAPSFYKRIKELPNVLMAPVYADSNAIINNSQMVAIINGTSGWEAILRGKPVINVSDYMFDVLELSKKCTDIEKLAQNIHLEQKRISKITAEERKRRITCFLAAILENGFWISHPNPFFYIEPGADTELEKCGKELAVGFVKYLQNLNQNRGYGFSI